MAFKFIVFCSAVLAYANAGLLSQPALGSLSYSSIASPSILAAPAVRTISALPAYSSQQSLVASPLGLNTGLPLAAAPLTRIAYSPANEVSHVYSSIAAPSALSLAPAQLSIQTPAIASSQQNTIRSLGGTISSYSKAIDTAYSSVRKSDTRISNNYYTPALATKTIALAPQQVYAQQPLLAQQQYIAQQPLLTKTLIAQQPLIAQQQVYAQQPLIARQQLIAQQPLLTKTLIAQQPLIAQQQLIAQQPLLAKTLIAQQPLLTKSLIASQPIVSHVSFDGIGAKYGW